MTTDTLLLKRVLGSAQPEDYVQWAVDLLCEGVNSYHLRILAGLDLRFEREEVEHYFMKTCTDLNIEAAPEDVGPRLAAGLVRKTYDQGAVSAQTALRMMADLYKISEYSDSLLAIWYEIDEELSLRGSGHEGCFYPPEALDSLDETFDREWALFERAAALSLPERFFQYIRCDKCGHIGEAKFSHKTFWDRCRAKFAFFRSKPALWAACRACGSHDYRTMADPRVRDDYFQRVESEQTLPPGAGTSRA